MRGPLGDTKRANRDSVGSIEDPGLLGVGARFEGSPSLEGRILSELGSCESIIVKVSF